MLPSALPSSSQGYAHDLLCLDSGRDNAPKIEVSHKRWPLTIMVVSVVLGSFFSDSKMEPKAQLTTLFPPVPACKHGTVPVSSGRINRGLLIYVKIPSHSPVSELSPFLFISFLLFFSRSALTRDSLHP